MVYTLVVHLYAKDDKECINKLIAKLQEASQVYTNDKECLGWYVLFNQSLGEARIMVALIHRGQSN